MADHSRWVRPLVTIVLAAASIAGLYNVLSDDTDLKHQAGKLACEVDDPPKPTQGSRVPWAQSYVFPCEKRHVAVSCMRVAILVGPYTCKQQE